MAQEPDFQDGKPGTVLTYEFRNTQPIELIDFTSSLYALAEQYRSYVRRRAGEFVDNDYRLFIKEVRGGSIVAELIGYAQQFPLLAPVTPLIVQYADSLVDCYKALKTVKETKELKDFFFGTTKKDLEQVSHILDPVAKDGGSQINFIANDGGMNVVNFHVTALDANAIQNGVRRQIEALPNNRSGIHVDQVIYWYQVRDDKARKLGDKGVIERFARYPVKVRFANDEVKKAMMEGPGSPFDQLFIVDVDVSEVDDKPVLYRILQVKDRFERRR